MKQIEQIKLIAQEKDLVNLRLGVASLRGHFLRSPITELTVGNLVQDTMDLLHHVCDDYSLKVDWDDYSSTCAFLRCFLHNEISWDGIQQMCEILLQMRASSNFSVRCDDSPKVVLEPSTKRRVEAALEHNIIAFLEQTCSVDDYMDCLSWDSNDYVNGLPPTAIDIAEPVKNSEGEYRMVYTKHAMSISNTGLARLKKCNGLQKEAMVRLTYNKLVKCGIIQPITNGAGLTDACCLLYDLFCAIGCFKHDIITKNHKRSEIRKAKRDRIKCIIFK